MSPTQERVIGALMVYGFVAVWIANRRLPLSTRARWYLGIGLVILLMDWLATR
jgi:hypothetical protein